MLAALETGGVVAERRGSMPSAQGVADRDESATAQEKDGPCGITTRSSRLVRTPEEQPSEELAEHPDGHEEGRL